MCKPENRTMWKQITRISFLGLTAFYLEDCGPIDFSTKVMPEKPAIHSEMRGARRLIRISLQVSNSTVFILRAKVSPQPKINRRLRSSMHNDIWFNHELS